MMKMFEAALERQASHCFGEEEEEVEEKTMADPMMPYSRKTWLAEQEEDL